MSFTVVVVAGKTFGETEKITIPKLNQLGQPSITVTGATTDLSNFSSTPATLDGQGLNWDTGNGEWEPSSANSILGTHVSVMAGATALAAGTQGTVPAPSAGEHTDFLRGDGTWQAPSGTNGSNLYLNETFI